MQPKTDGQLGSMRHEIDVRCDQSSYIPNPLAPLSLLPTSRHWASDSASRTPIHDLILDFPIVPIEQIGLSMD